MPTRRVGWRLKVGTTCRIVVAVEMGKGTGEGSNITGNAAELMYLHRECQDKADGNQVEFRSSFCWSEVRLFLLASSASCRFYFLPLPLALKDFKGSSLFPAAMAPVMFVSMFGLKAGRSQTWLEANEHTTAFLAILHSGFAELILACTTKTCTSGQYTGVALHHRATTTAHHIGQITY